MTEQSASSSRRGNTDRLSSVFSTSSFSLPGLSSRGQTNNQVWTSNISRASSSTPTRTYRTSYESPSTTTRSSIVAKPKQIKATPNSVNALRTETKWVCAISEGRGTGKEIGIAMMNVVTNRCTISQFADIQTYGHLTHMLASKPNAIILLPATSNAQKNTMGHVQNSDPIRQAIRQSLDLIVVDVPRKSFDENLGATYVDRLIVEDLEPTTDKIPTHSGAYTEVSDPTLSRTAILSSLVRKYYALSAVAALFAYLEQTCGRYLPPHSIRMRFEPPEGTVMIDAQTAKDLELVQNAVTERDLGSLYGVLNLCSTPMGERLLRMNILQPLANPDFIEHRLEAVEEVASESDFFYDLRESMKVLGSRKVDLDKTIAQLSSHAKSTNTVYDAKAVEAKLQCIINVWSVLQGVKALHGLFERSMCILLQTIKSVFEGQSLQIILAKIDECIEGDLLQGLTRSSLSSRNARLFAVRTGRDSILDAARQTYQENTADALDLCQQYSATYDLPFKAVFSAAASGGYSLELASGAVRLRDFPKEFVNVAKKKGGKVLSMTTVQLKKINQRLHDSATEIFLLSEQIVEALRWEILHDVAFLYRVSEAIALTDLILALSHYTLTGRRTRPQFGHELLIKQGRHPILDHRDEQGTIANDTAMIDGKRFLLLNGPNSSGKTTYLKQVMLLFVLAHIGSFVPAEEATFFPVDQLFSRLSNNEEPEANLSTFATEIRSINYILSMATKNSFVVIDELGRNTSTHDGIGIAHAISEVLIERGVSTVFATHFSQLKMTLAPYPTVNAQHFTMSLDTRDKGEARLSFAHRLVAGRLEEGHYGIALAKTCSLPRDVISDADAMLFKMELRDEARAPLSITATQEQAAARRRAVIDTLERLRNIVRDMRMTEPTQTRRTLIDEQRRLMLTLSKTYEDTTEGGDNDSDASAPGTLEMDRIDFMSDLSSRVV